MPSLMECIVDSVHSPNSPSIEEDLAQFDLDIMAIASVDGAWEIVDVGQDRSRPKVLGLLQKDFDDEGPSVYAASEYLIVRGRVDTHPIYFVQRKANIGLS